MVYSCFSILIISVDLECDICEVCVSLRIEVHKQLATDLANGDSELNCSVRKSHWIYNEAHNQVELLQFT